MKTYYEKLGKIGVGMIDALSKLGQQHRQSLEYHWAGVLEGKFTRSSYDDLKAEQSRERNQLIDSMDSQIDQLIAEYCSYTAESLAPNGRDIDAHDAETLRHFKLTPVEFDMLVDKHKHNNTMLRLLNDYRQQQGISSDWRYQDGQQRLERFKMAAVGVSSIVRQSETVNPYRREHIPQTVNRAYHETQGSYADQSPMPETQIDIPAMKHNVDMGAAMFSNLQTGSTTEPAAAPTGAQRDPMTGENKSEIQRLIDAKRLF